MEGIEMDMIVDLIHTFYPVLFWQYELVFIVRLLLAVLLGGLIGVERQWKKGKNTTAAGFRTHILATVGTCIFTVVSISMPQIAAAMPGGIINNADPGRIAAQAVSGIGFIGAGAILHSKGRVRGLTTAASLWVSAAIGMAVGAGLYLTAIVATSLALIILRWFSSLESTADKMFAKRNFSYNEPESEDDIDAIDAESVLCGIDFLEKTQEEQKLENE